MITLLTSATPNQIKALVQRISAAASTGRSGTQAWHQYLQATVNQTGTISDLEPLWLRQRIAALSGPTVPASATRSDLWGTYLSVKGHTGSLVDRFNQWLDHGTA